MGKSKDKEENADWVPYLDEANRTYYVNKQTGATQYENPYSYSDDSEDENEVAEKAPRKEKRSLHNSHGTASSVKARATHPYPSSSPSSSSHHTSSGLVKQPWEQRDQQSDTSRTAAAASSSGSATANSSSGWMPIEDGQGGVYFYNVHTGGSKWDMPAEVSAGSEWSTEDDGSENVYNISNRTGESLGELPYNDTASASSSLSQSLPMVGRGRWQRLSDASGRSYFFNEGTGETTWELPAADISAADKWEKKGHEADGRAFYSDRVAGEVPWDARNAAMVNHGGGAATASDGGGIAEAVSGVENSGETRTGGSETTESNGTKSTDGSWVVMTTEDGEQYLVDRATGQSRSALPQSLDSATPSSAPDTLGPLRTSMSSNPPSGSYSRPAADSWELRTIEDGQQYFFNRASGETRWTPPQSSSTMKADSRPVTNTRRSSRTTTSTTDTNETENSWEMLTTGDDQQYFICRATGESRWTPPESIKAAQPSDGTPGASVPYSGSRGTNPTAGSWQMFTTENGAAYFVDRATGESRWTPPQNQRGALLTGAPDSLVLGPTTGRTSLSNSTKSSKESWELCATDDGRRYFVNRATGESRWTPPQNQRAIPLNGASDGRGRNGVVTGRTTHSSSTESSMESWELCTTQYGQQYFVNTATGESRWIPPQSVIGAPDQGAPEALVPVPQAPSDSASQGSSSNKSLVDDHFSVSSGSSKSSASSTTTRSSAKKHVSFINAAASTMSMSSADNISNWVVTAQPRGSEAAGTSAEGHTAQMLQLEDAVSGVTEPPIRRPPMGAAPYGGITQVARESDGVEFWEESITDDGHSVYTNVSSGETRTTLSQPSLPAPPSTTQVERSASRQVPDQHPLLATAAAAAGVAGTGAMGLDVTATMTSTTTSSTVSRLRRSSTRDERISVAGFIARKVVLQGIAALVPELATRLHREIMAKVAEQFKQQKMVYKAAHNYNRKVQGQAPNVGTADYVALEAQKEGVDSDEDDDSYSPPTLRTSSNVSDSGSLSRSSVRVTDMRQLEQAGWRPRSLKPRPSARLHLVLSMLAQGQLDGHLLRDINLTCEQIGDAGVQQLCALLARSAVTTLILVSNGITDNGVSTLAQALQKNRSVYSLHLGGNLITDAGVRSLTLSLADSPALRILNLNGNPLTSPAGKDLALLLMDKKCRLSRLFVGGPLLAKDKVPQQQAAGKAIAGAPEQGTDSSTAPTQKRLGDLGVCYLAVALLQGGQCKLDTLWIPNVDMGIEGAKALAAVLCYNQRLHSLNISMNRIGEMGAEHLLKALRVNTGLRMLIADRCGISLATSQALQQALVRKPSLSWEDQKEYAAEVMEHLRWLRGVMKNVRFPLRAKEGRNEDLVGAAIVEKIQGGKDRQQGERTEGDIGPMEEAGKVVADAALHRTATKSTPAWVKAPEASLLRTLLDTTTPDTVKAWSTAWVENTASVVEMYISTLEALERDTRDTSAGTEVMLSEIREDLHTLLSTSQGVLRLHNVVEEAKRDHEAAAAERGVAESVEDDCGRRLRVCREGVFTDVSTGNFDDVRGLEDVSDEAVAVAEQRVKQASEWSVKAKHLETLARGRLAELEGRLMGAVRGAKDAEDFIRSETLELLLDRLRCRYRRVRIERLLREARAVNEVLRRASEERETQQKFQQLVPVTCGFPELDDRVRHCIMKQHQRKLTLVQAQSAAALIDEELQDALEDVNSLAAITQELSVLNDASDATGQASMAQVALLEKMLTFLDAMAGRLKADDTPLARTKKEDRVAEASGTEQCATQPMLLQHASTVIAPNSEKSLLTEAGTKQLGEISDTRKSATCLPALTQAVQAKARHLQDPVVDSYEQLCEQRGMVMEDLADINAELRDCQQLLEALTFDHYRLAKDRLPQSLQATTVMTMLPHRDPVDDLLKDTDLARPLRAAEKLTRLRARDLPEMGPVARKEGKKSSSVPVVSLSLHKHWDVLREHEVLQITRDDLRQIKSMVKQRRLKQVQERLMSTPGFQEILETLRSEPMPHLVKMAKEQGMSVKDLKTKEQLSMRLAALEFSRARYYA